jgi:hypothetical protein
MCSGNGDILWKWEKSSKNLIMKNYTSNFLLGGGGVEAKFGLACKNECATKTMTCSINEPCGTQFSSTLLATHSREHRFVTHN